MAVFYRYDYTEITKNIHPCLGWQKIFQYSLEISYKVMLKRLLGFGDYILCLDWWYNRQHRSILQPMAFFDVLTKRWTW